MSAPETPSNTQAHKRPWGWIALAGLLAAGLIAVGVYAVNLNSDLDDANAKVASQQKEIDQAQDKGAGSRGRGEGGLRRTERPARRGAGGRRSGGRHRREGAGHGQQAATDAQGTADELQKELDAAEAKADTAATCAQSFLSAFSGVFDAATVKEGVEATVAELKTLQPQCAPALGESS